MAILNLCRICLIEAHRSKGMQPLFDDSNEQCIKIVQMVEECGGIVLKPLDNYPRMICTQCLEALYASYQFRSMCQASESAVMEAIMKVKSRVHSKIITGCLVKGQSVETGAGLEERISHSVHPLHTSNQDISLNREDSNTNVDEIYLDLRSEYMEGHDVEFEQLVNIKTEFEHNQNYVTIEDMNTASMLEHSHHQQIDNIDEGDDGNDDDNGIDNDSDDTGDKIVAAISIDNKEKNSDELNEHESHHIEDGIECIQENFEQIEMTDLSAILTNQSKSKSKNNEAIKHANNLNTDEFISQLSKKSKGKNILSDIASCDKIPHKGRLQKTEENKKQSKAALITNLSGNRRKRKSDAEPEANICEICGNIYSKRSILNMHMRRHRAEKPFECEICGKTFTCPSEISRHIRIHTGEKPYVCRFCGRTFTDRSTNIKHERIHTNERPFTCQTCGKSFTYSNVLKNHILTHTGEKPFSCLPCNKTFSRKHQLDQHLATLTHRQSSKMRSATVNTTDESRVTTISTTTIESVEKLIPNKRSKEKNATSNEYKLKRIKITSNMA